ncbi:MAG: Gfo/Idh/MocA family oxidoreductase [Chloroflexota bacterium]
MRVGIIGAGSMGEAHATAWIETPAVIVGFVSRTAVSAHPLAKKYNAKVYPSLADILADVDVVDICTPTDLHFGMVKQAAAAGKHIVCEKPLARTVAEGREMIAICEAADVKLLVAHVLRYFPNYWRMQQQLVAGDIGRLAALRLRRVSSHPQKERDNWFANQARSGGMMLDLLIHDFDYARWLAGEVKTVHAQKMSSEQTEAITNHGLVTLTHENGVRSHIEGSWAYPPPFFQTQVEIAGTTGWLRYDSAETAVLATDAQQQATSNSNSRREDPFVAQLNAFYANLRDDAPIRVTAADGLAALQIALAAIASAKTGQPVHLSPLPEVVK